MILSLTELRTMNEIVATIYKYINMLVDFLRKIFVVAY